MNTLQLDKKYLAHDKEGDPLEVVRAEGSYVFDEKDKRYIDFFMGWNVGNFGWGNEEIKQQSHPPGGLEYLYPRFRYKAWGELAELLAELAPGKLQKSYRVTGGTEAVEAAMQVAMAYTGRNKFLSVEGAYHGNSIATISLAAKSYRDKLNNKLNGCYKIDPPLNTKTLGKIETRLKKKDIAAFIMEPVIFNLGVLIPDKEFMTGLRELCTRYGTLLIADEVGTGFGSTGKLFAIEHFDIEPDIMTMAKGITGGYGALGATITTAEIADTVEGHIQLYSTFGWHPVAVEAAIASISYLKKHRQEIFENISRTNQLFAIRLNKMSFGKDVELRMIGLAIGIDMKDEKAASSLMDKCRQNGLLINTQGGTACLFPALNIDEKVANEGLDILEASLQTS